MSLIRRPVFDRFGSGDDRPQRNLAAVYDPMIFVGAAAERIHIFTVDSGSNDHFISRACDFGSLADRGERVFLCAASSMGSICRYIINHR
jgi:hypothetical protein